ncbi:alpha/beta hydrolase [Lacticaseibacillus baoqingensis]|uniref:Alpha/beta hydrolase n=1 Tax=Lacticaseibacillus baoqingensis TaxID=2486013 RepID=A0ABW4E519_9LACO|nr:alpha/beta hydrolase [Lacticaseibacillus baoqingensis]
MPKWLKVLILSAIVLLVGGGIFSAATTWMHRQVRDAKVVHNSQMQPIILVPGSSATQERFNSLITTLNQQTTGHSLLKITVKTNGTLVKSGKLAARDNEPYIVVAFQNNHDGYNNIKKQARWFDQALKHLTATYHFNRFRAIGHSNGGLVLSLFLEKYYASADVSIDRLMTIGTPYNLEESNPHNRTQMLNDLIAKRKSLPKTLTVYSLAGTETYDGDGTVPLNSVECGKYIYQNQAAHYTQITVSGDNAKHSDLPQNREIINYIQQYMLQTPNQTPGRSQPTDSQRRMTTATP